jgi:hypothetical protein
MSHALTHYALSDYRCLTIKHLYEENGSMDYWSIKYCLIKQKIASNKIWWKKVWTESSNIWSKIFDQTFLRKKFDQTSEVWTWPQCWEWGNIRDWGIKREFTVPAELYKHKIKSKNYPGVWIVWKFVNTTKKITENFFFCLIFLPRINW